MQTHAAAPISIFSRRTARLRTAQPSDFSLLQNILALACLREQEQRRFVEVQLRQATHCFSAVAEVLRRIAHPGSSIEDVLSLTAERACEITWADGAAIALAGDNGTMRCVASNGSLVPPVGAEVPEGGISGECVHSGLTVLCTDTDTDPRVNSALCREWGLHSVVVVPIRTGSEDGDGVIGLIEVCSSQARAFGARETDALEMLAALIGHAVRVFNLQLPASPVKASPSLEEKFVLSEALLPARNPSALFRGCAEPPGGDVWERKPILPPKPRQPAWLGWPVVLGAIAALAVVGLIVVGVRTIELLKSRSTTLTVNSSTTTPASVPVTSRSVPNKALPAVPMTAIATLSEVKHSSKKEFTAVEILLDRPVKVHADRLSNPDRIYFDLPDTRIADQLVSRPNAVRILDVKDALVNRIRVARKASTVARIVLDLKCACQYSYVLSEEAPYRLVIDVEALRPKQ